MAERVVNYLGQISDQTESKAFAHLTAEQVASSPYFVEHMDQHLDWRGEQVSVMEPPGTGNAPDKEYFGYDIVVDSATAAAHARLTREWDLRLQAEEPVAEISPIGGRHRSWLSNTLALIRIF